MALPRHSFRRIEASHSISGNADPTLHSQVEMIQVGASYTTPHSDDIEALSTKVKEGVLSGALL